MNQPLGARQNMHGRTPSDWYRCAPKETVREVPLAPAPGVGTLHEGSFERRALDIELRVCHAFAPVPGPGTLQEGS